MWAPYGRSLLVSFAGPTSGAIAGRFFPHQPDERTAEFALFDSAVRYGSLSPDGKLLLLHPRGSAPCARQGYTGSQDSQVCVYDIEANTSRKLLLPPGWPSGRSGVPTPGLFYFVGPHKGTSTPSVDLRTGQTVRDRVRRLSVVLPASPARQTSVSGTCSTSTLNPGFGRATGDGRRLARADLAREAKERPDLTNASQVASSSGLEVAFVLRATSWS